MMSHGAIESTTFIRPLDFVTGSACAYSLWLLRSTYTGFAFQAQRSSDSATTDVSFDITGVVSDNSTVSAGGTFGTWRGASTITIRTYYDQSGNACNLTQTTLTKQPIYTANNYLGRPAPRIVSPRLMTGTNTVLQSPVNSCSIFSRMNVDNGSVSNTFMDGGDGATTNGLTATLPNAFRMIYRSPYTNSGGDSVQSSAGNVPSATYFSYIGVRDSSSNNQIVYKNNVSVGTLASLTQPAMPATNMIMSFGGNAGVSTMTGYLFAVIIFPFALTAAQRTYLDANI